MSDTFRPGNHETEPTVYQIRIHGHLDERWAGRFGEAKIMLEENGETLISCTVVDQAALYGLLRKVRDLGMPLLSVTRTFVDTGEDNP